MEEVTDRSNKPDKHPMESDDEIKVSNCKRMKMDCSLEDENNISVTEKILPESPVHNHDADVKTPFSCNQLSTETKSNNQDDVDGVDPWGYTKAEDFTSEIFKIQIYNLPKFGFNDLKKRLKSTLNLNPHKIKHINKIFVTYVCFKNEADRDEALKKINGHVWKGKTLEAKIAKPAADPYLQKHLQEKGNCSTEKNSKSNFNQDKVQLTAEEAEARLRSNVIPLWDVEYEEQLQIKAKKIRNILGRVTKHHFVKHMFEDKSKQDGLPCELLPIVPSPITKEYRNKNEFSIGFGLDGKTKMVGFRYGLYKDGTTAVGSCEHLEIAMPAAIPVVKSFIEFISNSQWEPFLQQSGTGHWQTLTVRTQQTGDIMAMVDFNPRKLDQSEVAAAKNSLKEFFTLGGGKDVRIKSFYFRIPSGKGQKTRNNLELLLGEPHVYESLLEMNFRISPQAFFQVNTPATEKLYELIADWCNVSSSTTVLDICCGTGTIGLSMAKIAKTVIGVEMCSEAVEDAKANASLNDISNAVFHCAKVEDIISKIISSLQSSDDGQDVVAVVDPPRAGLHKDVIKSLRKCQAIRRLVYVSCNPDSALDNFIDIIRPETGRHKGSPYRMVKATPVDLFPGTKHCELLILFDRVEVGSDVGSHVSSDAPVTDSNTHVTTEVTSNVTVTYSSNVTIMDTTTVNDVEVSSNVTVTDSSNVTVMDTTTVNDVEVSSNVKTDKVNNDVSVTQVTSAVKTSGITSDVIVTEMISDVNVTEMISDVTNSTAEVQNVKAEFTSDVNVIVVTSDVKQGENKDDVAMETSDAVTETASQNTIDDDGTIGDGDTISDGGD